MIDSAGVIAAGEGSRLKLDGIEIHKPLVPICGYPLVGHTLRQLIEAGIQRAVIIFNEAQQECANWVHEHFPSLELEILVKSTSSSFESFWRVGRALGPGRHLICAVDSICAPADWRKMVTSNAGATRELVLGVTSFVHDEKPLWVKTEPGSLKIAELGGLREEYATAGFYNVGDDIFEREPILDISSLRVFLQQLLREGFPASAVPLADVIDVDTAEDIQIAERFMARLGRSL
jgi:choline kinase